MWNSRLLVCITPPLPLQCRPQEVCLKYCTSLFAQESCWLDLVQLIENALRGHYQTVNWFATISVSCVISWGGGIYDYLRPPCIVTAPPPTPPAPPGCGHGSPVSCRDRCSLDVRWYVWHVCVQCRHMPRCSDIVECWSTSAVLDTRNICVYAIEICIHAGWWRAYRLLLGHMWYWPYVFWCVEDPVLSNGVNS